MFRIVCLYLKWIFSAPRVLKGASDEQIAGWSLLNKTCFRLPAGASKDYLIVLRQWKKAIGKNKPVSVPVLAETDTERSWVFDNRAVTRDLRVEHVEYSIGKKVSFFAARDQLTGMPGCSRFSDAIILTCFLPFFFTWSLFSSRRAAIAMLLVEMKEAAAMIRLSRILSVRRIYFYCPFQKDANALYLLFRKEQVEVYKIPSPSLLAIHHQQLLSDVLVLTSPYQEDELETFRENIRISSVLRWVPELYLTYGKRYENWIRPQRNTIGYYSHATWLRLESKTADEGEGEIDAENKLIPVLAEILKKYPQFELKIFLHPKEKRYQPFEKVQAFYASRFAGIKFSFAEAELSSTMQYDSVETGIGAISTILFERLFAGYKTILFPVGVKDFPLPGTVLSRVCAMNPADLEKCLLESAGAEEEKYFSETGLSRYIGKNWLKSGHE